jgi:hypothetical protein
MITFDRPNPPQIKIEGIFWQMEATNQGMKIIDTEATCQHQTFDTFREFARRQFVHGAADVTFYKLQGRFPLLAPLSSLGHLRSKSVALFSLLRERAISPKEFVLAVILLGISAPVRLFGSILFSSAKANLNRGLISSPQTNQTE